MVRDYLIIGAGPAGLQLAAALERDGRDYLVLERGSGPGTFFTRFPRHRQLISINKVHTGYDDPELRLRMDWNSLLSDDPELLFTRYSDDYFPRADDLVRYLTDYATRTGVRAEYGTEVVRVSRPDGVFTVEAADGRTWRARRLIVATGVSRLNVPAIPGIELDSYQLKSQNAVLDGTVESVEKAPGGGYRVLFRYARTTEKPRELRYDRIVLAAGFRFDASVFEATCRPALVIDDRFPEQSAAYEPVTVPDLYFAGTLTQQRDFKRSTNGFIHGFRHGVRALHRVLDARYHDTPWPARPLPAAPEAIADAVVERVNRSSGLWQQFGFLGDVIGVDGGPGRLPGGGPAGPGHRRRTRPGRAPVRRGPGVRNRTRRRRPVRRRRPPGRRERRRARR